MTLKLLKKMDHKLKDQGETSVIKTSCEAKRQDKAGNIVPALLFMNNLCNLCKTWLERRLYSEQQHQWIRGNTGDHTECLWRHLVSRAQTCSMYLKHSSVLSVCAGPSASWGKPDPSCASSSQRTWIWMSTWYCLTDGLTSALWDNFPGYTVCFFVVNLPLFCNLTRNESVSY